MSLFEAVKGGNVRALVKELNRDPDRITSLNHHRSTLLHIACLHGHRDIVEELLLRNANCDSLDEWGWKPADRAANNGHWDCLKMVLPSTSPPLKEAFRRSLKRGHGLCAREVVSRDPSVLDPESCSPTAMVRVRDHAEALVKEVARLKPEFINNAEVMFEALRFDRPTIVRQILDESPTLSDPSVRGSRRWDSCCALSAAVMWCREAVPWFSKDRKALEQIDDQGRTPLHHAVGGDGYLGGLLDQMLPSHFPKPFCSRAMMDVYSHGAARVMDRLKYTPLHLAIATNQRNATCLLLELGAPVFLLDPAPPRQPVLLRAFVKVSNRRIPSNLAALTCTYLVPPPRPKTALELVLERPLLGAKSVEMIHAILDHAPWLCSQSNADGDTALHLLLRNISYEREIGNLLFRMRYWADERDEQEAVMRRNNLGQTPLHVLVQNTKLQGSNLTRLVNSMTFHLSDLDAPDNEGTTSLMILADRAYSERSMYRILSEGKGDMTMRDGTGQSVLARYVRAFCKYESAKVGTFREICRVVMRMDPSVVQEAFEVAALTSDCSKTNIDIVVDAALCVGHVPSPDFVKRITCPRVKSICDLYEEKRRNMKHVRDNTSSIVSLMLIHQVWNILTSASRLVS